MRRMSRGDSSIVECSRRHLSYLVRRCDETCVHGYQVPWIRGKVKSTSETTPVTSKPLTSANDISDLGGSLGEEKLPTSNATVIHCRIQIWADRLESAAARSGDCLYFDNSLTLNIREIDHTLPLNNNLDWLWLGLG